MSSTQTTVKSPLAPTVMRIGNMHLDAQQASKVIHSVGWDAGNAHAAAKGRSVWNEDDYNAACQTSNQLMRKFGLAPPPRAKKIRAKRARS